MRVVEALSLYQKLCEAMLQVIVEAQVNLPVKLEAKLRELYKRARGLARTQLEAILRNIEIAREERVPICQDTGLLTFFVKLPSWISAAELRKAAEEAVRKATREGFLRVNVVHPLTRKVIEDNVGLSNPIMYFEQGDNDLLEIKLLVKGAGSENNCIAFCLAPKEGVDGVIKAVVNHVAKYGAAACPPLLLGVGIGGTLDYATYLSKMALFQLFEHESEFAEVEEELLKKVNELGIGVMGLGEGPTAIGVKILCAGCHTASLPVAVNVQCWALRMKTLRMNRLGEYTIC